MSIYRMRTQFGGGLKILLGLIAFGFLVGGIFTYGGMPNMGNRGGGTGASAVIAKVNDESIKRGDYDSVREQMEMQAREMGVRSPLEYAKYRKMIFQSLVNSRLMVSAAGKMGVEVSDSKVDEQVEKQVTMLLNQNRQAILGKLDDKRAATDPRNDSEYKSQLASINSSISQQEADAKSRVPVEQIRAQLVEQALRAKLASQTKSVSEEDVRNSYSVYKIRQIVIEAGAMPKEQVSARAAKIVSAARGGADFAALARENSDHPSKKDGGAASLSFGDYSVPPNVRDMIMKMKPGDVSPAIDTQYGSYIVKLEGVAPKMPANLDKKALSARREAIQKERADLAWMAFQSQLSTKQKIEVMDPELLAYWKMSQAQAAFADPVTYKKQIAEAITALQKAVQEQPNNMVALAELAELQANEGNPKEAERVLYAMLDSPKTATQEGSDLRILFGDVYLKLGKPDDAVKQYTTASEIARNDESIHRTLMLKFQQLRRPDLVAAEKKWQDDYSVRMAQMKAMEKKTAPGGKPVPVSAPAAPKPGG